MVMFTGAHPGDRYSRGRRVPFPPPGSVPPNNKIADANPGTFYSALSNINFEIGNGNPAAIAIRFHGLYRTEDIGRAAALVFDLRSSSAVLLQ